MTLSRDDCIVISNGLEEAMNWRREARQREDDFTKIIYPHLINLINRLKADANKQPVLEAVISADLFFSLDASLETKINELKELNFSHAEKSILQLKKLREQLHHTKAYLKILVEQPGAVDFFSERDLARITIALAQIKDPAYQELMNRVAIARSQIAATDVTNQQDFDVDGLGRKWLITEVGERQQLCAMCEAPIEQRSRRARLYCDRPGCRKRASREKGKVA